MEDEVADLNNLVEGNKGAMACGGILVLIKVVHEWAEEGCKKGMWEGKGCSWEWGHLGVEAACTVGVFWIAWCMIRAAYEGPADYNTANSEQYVRGVLRVLRDGKAEEIRELCGDLEGQSQRLAAWAADMGRDCIGETRKIAEARSNACTIIHLMGNEEWSREIVNSGGWLVVWICEELTKSGVYGYQKLPVPWGEQYVHEKLPVAWAEENMLKGVTIAATRVGETFIDHETNENSILEMVEREARIKRIWANKSVLGRHEAHMWLITEWYKEGRDKVDWKKYGELAKRAIWVYLDKKHNSRTDVSITHLLEERRYGIRRAESKKESRKEVEEVCVWTESVLRGPDRTGKEDGWLYQGRKESNSLGEHILKTVGMMGVGSTQDRQPGQG